MKEAKDPETKKGAGCLRRIVVLFCVATALVAGAYATIPRFRKRVLYLKDYVTSGGKNPREKAEYAQVKAFLREARKTRGEGRERKPVGANLEARTNNDRLEESAIQSLRMIVTAQALIKELDEGGRYRTLSDLAKKNLVDSVLGAGTKEGYLFESEPGSDAKVSWWATAVPVLPGETGDRFFFVGVSGEIFVGEGPLAFDKAAASPPKNAVPLQ